MYRGADKSLARPGRKQASVTKLWLLQATQKKKKFRRLSVQPGLCGSNEDVGRKMATYQLFLQSGRAKDLSAPQYLYVYLFILRSVYWILCCSHANPICWSFTRYIKGWAVLYCSTLFNIIHDVLDRDDICTYFHTPKHSSVFLYRTDMVKVLFLHICGKITCLCIRLSSSDRKRQCTRELCFISRLLSAHKRTKHSYDIHEEIRCCLPNDLIYLAADA